MLDRNHDTDDLKEVLDLGPKRPKWRRRVIILLIILLLGAGGAWFWQKPTKATAKVAFRTAEAARGDLEVLVSATGSLEPVVQVDVGTEVSGTIRSIKVDFNDLVKKGQVLAILDTSKLEAQRDQAAASLAVAQAELENARAGANEAKIDLERQQKAFEMSKGRLPSRQTIDSSQAAYDKAQAQVSVYQANLTKARASLKAYESDLEKAVVKSPINGLVLDRKVEPGQTVAASLEAPVLFTLAENLVNMKLCVAVDEADVGRVKEGQRATFVVDAYPDRRFPAKITQVRFAPQDEDGVITYDCILEVNNRDLLLRPGMTATADIVTVEVKDALLVPNMALRFKPDMPGQNKVTPKENSGGSILSKIMPRPPRRRSNKNNGNGAAPAASGAGQAAAQGTVWVIRDQQPTAVKVGLGASDGVKTQITSGDLKPGQPVIIGQMAVNQ